jgi:hypothetical protein
MPILGDRLNGITDQKAIFTVIMINLVKAVAIPTATESVIGPTGFAVALALTTIRSPGRLNLRSLD